MALFAFQMLPVNYAGLALILLGVGFLVAEVFVPSFGALGVGGIVAFAIGSVMLIDTDVPGFGVPLCADRRRLALACAAFFILVVGMAAQGAPAPVGWSAAASADRRDGEMLEFCGGEGWAPRPRRALAGARRAPLAQRPDACA